MDRKPGAIHPTSTDAPFLQIRGLQARFISHLGELEALDEVSFSVDRGEFVCLIGPSGCGKSTLLRIVAGLIPPTEGEILLEGRPRQLPSSRVGLVFQQPTLLPWRTVNGNVALPLQMRGVSDQETDRRTSELLALVGLSDFGNEYPANLSGGMAQRAAIARALAQHPELLLLDEPFGSLDAITRERMASELLRIWEQNHRTVLMVTHSVEEATLLSDRVVVLSARPGHVVDIVEVSLPRPRSPGMLSSPKLQAVAQRLRERLFWGNGGHDVRTKSE
ncbi:MAG: ABC transporter ATP-binding protein [Anaerolineae bacterium]